MRIVPVSSRVNNRVNNKPIVNNQLAQKFNKNILQAAQTDVVSFSANALKKDAYSETKALYDSASDIMQKALDSGKNFEFEGKFFSNEAKEKHISSPVMKNSKDEECWLEYAPAKPCMRYGHGPLHISYEKSLGITAAVRKNDKVKCVSVLPDKSFHDKSDVLSFHVYDKNGVGSYGFLLKPNEKDFSAHMKDYIDTFNDVTKTFLDLMND